MNHTPNLMQTNYTDPAANEVVLRKSAKQPSPEKREETVSFTLSAPLKKPHDEVSVDQKPQDNRLLTSYTLPKRQLASASPVPFYKNQSMQNNNTSPSSQTFYVKVPSSTLRHNFENETPSASATLSLSESTSLSSSPRNLNKKSLFDLDNANSLSLADKLRNEANKYTDISASNKSLNMVETKDLSKREQITGSTQSLTDNVILNHATPKQIQYAERRPSWRLKFDAGSKVQHQEPK